MGLWMDRFLDLWIDKSMDRFLELWLDQSMQQFLEPFVFYLVVVVIVSTITFSLQNPFFVFVLVVGKRRKNPVVVVSGCMFHRIVQKCYKIWNGLCFWSSTSNSCHGTIVCCVSSMFLPSGIAEGFLCYWWNFATNNIVFVFVGDSGLL